MASREEIEYAIRQVLQQSKLAEDITDIRSRVTQCILQIAAGMKLPDGRVSSPLPDLYSSGTVDTATDAAYVSLPATYQRKVLMVADDNDEKLYPPRGGDYYSFNTFLRKADKKDLSESGSINMVCVNGSNLYYQGIPSTAETLTVHFFRLPVEMADDDAVPDGIPSTYALDLIKHWVLADIWGDNIGVDLKADLRYPDKAFSKQRHHLGKFYETMDRMMIFIGDHYEEPTFYASDSEYDEEYDGY